MRLGKFESAGVEPIGKGKQKDVFIDPKNEKRVIAEIIRDKDTPRQLKGRYRLTRLAHLLLPKNIPDVYQAGETVEGQQFVDAERIAHTEKHTLLQKGYSLLMVNQMKADLKEKREKLNSELRRIGLGLGIDLYIKNYTKDEAGNVYYLETFKPWIRSMANPTLIRLRFDAKKMRQAIDELSDEKVREKCIKHLERILALAEKERQELEEREEENGQQQKNKGVDK